MAVAGGRTSTVLQNDNDSSSPQPETTATSSWRPVSRQTLGSLRPVGAATVQVIQELDQLLTMETLIYLVQAVIELLVLSFHFAYQAQPVTAQPTGEQQPVRRTTLQRSTRISSVKRPVWDKRRQVAAARHSQTSESLSILVSPDTAQKNKDRVGVGGIVAVAQTSGTGTLSLTPPRHVPSPINSGLPPPPSVPLIPQPSLVPHSLFSFPSSPVAVAVTESNTPSSASSSVESNTRSPSTAKSPRRKPVQSAPGRKSSAKFDRPQLATPETAQQQPHSSASTDSDIHPQSPVDNHQKPLGSTLVPTSPEPFAPPFITKKSSSKSLSRQIVPISQVPQQTFQIPPASVPPLYPAPEKPVDQTGTTNPRPLVRKSSAKFLRPLPSNSTDSALVEQTTAVQTQSPQTQSVLAIIPTEQTPPQRQQQPQPHLQVQPPVQRTPRVEPPLQGQPQVQPQAQPQVQPDVRTQERPQSQTQAQPQLLPQLQPLPPPQLEAPLALLEPVPQRPAPEPKAFLFPPRPAVALAQPVSDPIKPPPREPSPFRSSFPDLPPLVLANPRQPPPPPSIPRFPSPPKSTRSSPSPPPRVYSNPGRRISPSASSSSKRHASMAAMATYPEDVETSSQNWTLPEEESQNDARTDVPREWDPSQDENIFEPNSNTVPKPVISTTPDQRFSYHGSIDSQSSSESPPNASRGRLSTQSSSPNLMDRTKHTRAVSTNSQYIPSPVPSPRARPHSAGSVSSGSEYVPPAFLFDNTHLKPGNAAALLTHAETLNLYRQNAKKAVDNPATQYEFAIFMMDAAREATLDLNGVSPSQRDEFLKEGLSILRRLADRGYPQAQYYLADCYSNGIGCKHGTPDLEKAFPLFVLAAKHGHVEASFRTALAYENAWGCRKDPLKALQFLRKAASANHPGAMLRLGMACLNSEFGMPTTQLVTVEGVNWLKRAVEAATPLYPNAPYELALLHEFGYKDVVFTDEAYAVQLFARASDLGHADAAYRLGDAYEYGRMGCPEDPGLSIHYYSLSARGGNASAMLSLCAWYMVGAEGFLEKSDAEAFAWAQKAAELGHAKAEFATGYFLERGVGCRRDALEAWKYYVRAADHGDERAIARLRAGKDLNSDRSMLASAVSSEVERGRLSTSDRDSNASSNRRASPHKIRSDLEEDAKAKDKDCIVM